MVTAALATIAMTKAWSVLVFTKTAGYRHDSIETGVQCITELGEKNGFTVDHTEDDTQFNADNLKKYTVVVFLSTTQNVLEGDEQTAFQNYIESGHGYVGIHAAADTGYDWPWYGQLVGAYFMQHPAIQEAKVEVVDRKHPATAHLPAEWTRTDEWYDFKSLPPAGARILCKLDQSSYKGSKMPGEHPITWCQNIKKGRSFYTAMGHTKESYADPLYQKHLLGAILWAAKKK